MATIEQVFAIADAIRPWCRGLVLLAAFTGVRWGELVELRRHNLDLRDGFVRVTAATGEVRGVLRDGQAPKSKAGLRLVGVPAAILPDLRQHVAKWSEPGPHGRVFVGPKGGVPRRSNYWRYWQDAVTKAGLDGLGLHFHDLRHTANDFVAGKLNLRDQMTRMGHASPRAALIYQRASRERERQVTEALSQEIEAVRPSRSGTDLARRLTEDAGTGEKDLVGAEGLEPPTSSL